VDFRSLDRHSILSDRVKLSWRTYLRGGKRRETKRSAGLVTKFGLPYHAALDFAPADPRNLPASKRSRRDFSRQIFNPSAPVVIQQTFQFVAWKLCLAQDAPPAADAETSFLVQLVNNPLLPMVGIIAIFYLVFVIPERRRKTEEAKRMASIKKNDRVITAGGLHGTVVNAPSDSDVVTVRLDDNGTLRVKVSRWALTVVADKTSTEKPAGKDS